MLLLRFVGFHGQPGGAARPGVDIERGNRRWSRSLALRAQPCARRVEGSEIRKRCDDRFHAAMERSCDEDFGGWWEIADKHICLKFADLYHWGVWQYGQKSWRDEGRALRSEGKDGGTVSRALSNRAPYEPRRTYTSASTAFEKRFSSANSSGWTCTRWRSRGSRRSRRSHWRERS